MADPIEQAIAAAAPQAQTVTASGVFNSTGRRFSVTIPADPTDLELLALIGRLVALRDELQQQAKPAARLLVPVGTPIPGVKPS